MQAKSSFASFFLFCGFFRENLLESHFLHKNSRGIPGPDGPQRAFQVARRAIQVARGAYRGQPECPAGQPKSPNGQPGKSLGNNNLLEVKTRIKCNLLISLQMNLIDNLFSS